MGDVVHASPGELTASEILAILDRGDRVVIDTTVLGQPRAQVMRKQNGTYYCDTSTKLFTHETKAGMRSCLKRIRLVTPEPTTN